MTLTIVPEAERAAADAILDYVYTAQPSDTFYCRHCEGRMAFTFTPAGEPVIECAHCGWTVAAQTEVIDEVFRSDSRLARILRLMAASGVSYDLARLAIDTNLAQMPEGDWLDTNGMRVKVAS